MTEWLKALSSIIGYIVGIGSGLIVIYGWVVKPLKAIKEENANQSKMLKALDEDTADLLCSQLTREHDYYLTRGWCSASDKRRLEGIYTRYKRRGRNHVAERYMQDITALPEHYQQRSWNE